MPPNLNESDLQCKVNKKKTKTEKKKLQEDKTNKIKQNNYDHVNFELLSDHEELSLRTCRPYPKHCKDTTGISSSRCYQM